MMQTWITVVALGAEALGVTFAATGVRRSLPCYDRGTSEPWWASGGLALVAFAGERSAETTRFTDAGHNCPGDDDLENVLSADQLVEALDATFRIVEDCLDRWTLDMLEEQIRRPDYGPDWVHSRGSVLQRVFSHDVWHCAELNETLRNTGLPHIDLWD